MSEGPGVLFAYILDALSRKPQLSETQNNLLNDVKDTLNSEGVQMVHLKKDFETAIDIGRDLGVLTIRDEKVRMQFSLNGPTDFSKPSSIMVYRSPNDASTLGYENKKRYGPEEDFRRKNRARSRRRSRTRSRSRRRSKKGRR